MRRPSVKLQLSHLELQVAESNDYFSIFCSPDCWESFNSPISQLGCSTSLPPLATLGSLPESNPGYFQYSQREPLIISLRLSTLLLGPLSSLPPAWRMNTAVF